MVYLGTIAYRLVAAIAVGMQWGWIAGIGMFIILAIFFIPLPTKWDGTVDRSTPLARLRIVLEMVVPIIGTLAVWQVFGTAYSVLYFVVYAAVMIHDVRKASRRRYC